MISFYWSLFLLFFQQFQFKFINIIHNSKLSNSIILTCDLILKFYHIISLEYLYLPFLFSLFFSSILFYSPLLLFFSSYSFLLFYSIFFLTLSLSPLFYLYSPILFFSFLFSLLPFFPLPLPHSFPHFFSLFFLI